MADVDVSIFNVGQTFSIKRRNKHPRSHSHSHSHPYSEIMQDNAAKSTNVSFLVNTQYYFLGTVFILPEVTGYRLVVIHKWKVLKNDCFPTLEEAKKAFFQHFQARASKKVPHPIWDDNHRVDNDWLKKKLKIITRHPLLNYLHRLKETLFLKFICLKVLHIRIRVKNKK
ncbi:MAG: hypothetical protein GTO45_41240 [Candidatus Aminicenantes bacterium]|nr:hypothetical protein [Candidatus Aminicenantes bacterium]NIM85030.1 hypothetical protein [Candidatus Aminicenantes bacterium]NIN24544.1 hypothetical protein [Candidatus Aminicenantes bacterium]NIN48308.1 hypothetical protein [Candidatus Aminicenantes bacterium]NIN91211.1 hypothetical protein [Candidatus Aminicenantes bacterium]